MKKWRIAGAAILAVLLALFCASQVLQAVNVQNVFDEMYYGHKDTSPFYFLYPATYRGYGWVRLLHEYHYFSDNVFIEHLKCGKPADHKSISVMWYLNEKELHYSYWLPLPYSDDHFLHFTATYDVEENRLTILPLYLQKDEKEATKEATHELPSLMELYSFSREDIEQLFNNGLVECVTNRWFEVNEGQSRFNKDDFGELTVENHMFDDFPELN